MISSRPPLLASEQRQTPVIQDQQLHQKLIAFSSRAWRPSPRASANALSSRSTMIGDRAVVPTRLVAERAGEPRFTDPGRADDEKVLFALDPVAGRQFLEQRTVEAAWCTQIDLLDDGFLAQTANRRRVISRLFSRSIVSRSSSSANRSSKVQLRCLVVVAARRGPLPYRSGRASRFLGGDGQALDLAFSGSSRGRGVRVQQLANARA